ncbi:hypothetical protein BEWA_029640 [Theileria equi strain WA]|uniref:Uncharacterized protein n=1 Tax=Theileria equi strain WA TaxID=1537102 RepID=L0AXW9_THEEQ|nr:hypothetical protein BEWA_029640 [Theileria equi strain WA]AFZ80113.1 hypothetical protein BEWA_029640 [Theileria equi strain WA]|eukprot:XP_004829779.1 hypothetical protein BEWA_029640 [Theileria equi strain WA]
MEIGDLLKCLSSIVKVNYYDRDLLRMLSREFVDDMDKLDIEQISTLLHCYYKQNVYSCDLVETAGRIATGILDKIEDPVVVQEEPVEETGLFGMLKSILPQKQVDKPVIFTHKYLSGIARYFSYFGYKNPGLFLSIARVLMAHQRTIDLFTKSIVFSSINPAMLIQACKSLAVATDSTGPPDNPMGVTRTNIVALLECARDEMESGHALKHENDPDEFDMGILLSSSLMSKDTAKLVYDIFRVSSSVKNLSKMALRYLDNLCLLSLIDKRQDVNLDERLGHEEVKSYRETLEVLMAKISDSVDELVDLNGRLGSRGMVQHASKEMDGYALEHENLPSISKEGGYLPKDSPYLASIRNIFIDSLSTSMAVVNAFLRVSCGSSVHFCDELAPPTVGDESINSPSKSKLHQGGVAKVLKYTLEDNNIHTRLHQRAGDVRLDYSVRRMATRVAEQMELYGCLGQSVHNLTNVFETFCLLSTLDGGMPLGTENVSKEVIKQLVTFDRESIYRIKLAMNMSGLKDEDLDYYINKFPRFTRMDKRKHRMTFSDPWTRFINVNIASAQGMH